MILEVTLKGAIIWKALATVIFILLVTGVIKRIFKLKMIHWILSVVGIICLILALNIGLIEKITSAFKKKEIKKEYITIEKQLDQDSLNLLYEFRAENEKLKHAVVESQSNPQEPEITYKAYLQTDPKRLEFNNGVYTKVFDVPGNGNHTGSWILPHNPDGWRVRITWTGNPIWFPEENNSNSYILMEAGKDIDLGDHNPDNMNFCFKATDGQPATVNLEYWSKLNKSHH